MQNSDAILTPTLVSFILSSLIAGQIMTRTGRYKIVAVVAAQVMSVGFFLPEILLRHNEFYEEAEEEQGEEAA